MAESPVDTALAEALRPYVAMHDARVSTDRCQCSLCLRARAALASVPARSPDALTEALTWLREKGQHPDDCAIWVELDDVTGYVHPVGECSCGLAALAHSAGNGDEQ